MMTRAQKKKREDKEWQHLIEQFKYKPPDDVLKSEYSGYLTTYPMYLVKYTISRELNRTVMRSSRKELNRTYDVDYRINRADYTIFEKPYVKEMKHLAIDSNGLLVRMENGSKRIIIPTSLRTDIVFYYHKSDNEEELVHVDSFEKECDEAIGNVLHVAQMDRETILSNERKEFERETGQEPMDHMITGAFKT
eukprot:340469_1